MNTLPLLLFHSLQGIYGDPVDPSSSPLLDNASIELSGYTALFLSTFLMPALRRPFINLRLVRAERQTKKSPGRCGSEFAPVLFNIQQSVIEIGRMFCANPRHQIEIDSKRDDPSALSVKGQSHL